MLLQAVSVAPTTNLFLLPDRVMSDNVLAVADAREFQRAGVPKGEPLQAAKRQPSCYVP